MNKKDAQELVDKLRELAKDDQGYDINRPWTYTSNCPMCGGVGAFIDWFESGIDLVFFKD